MCLTLSRRRLWRPPGAGPRCRCRMLSPLRGRRRCGRRWQTWQRRCCKSHPPRRPPMWAARPWCFTGDSRLRAPDSLMQHEAACGPARTSPCFLLKASLASTVWHPGGVPLLMGRACTAPACSRSAPGPSPTIITPHGGPHTAYSAQFFMPLTYLVSLGEKRQGRLGGLMACACEHSKWLLAGTGSIGKARYVGMPAPLFRCTYLHP